MSGRVALAIDRDSTDRRRFTRGRGLPARASARGQPVPAQLDTYRNLSRASSHSGTDCGLPHWAEPSSLQMEPTHPLFV